MQWKELEENKMSEDMRERRNLFTKYVPSARVRHESTDEIL